MKDLSHFCCRLHLIGPPGELAIVTIVAQWGQDNEKLKKRGRISDSRVTRKRGRRGLVCGASGYCGSAMGLWAERKKASVLEWSVQA